MKTSDLFSLNWTDAGKGLLCAVAGAVISQVTASIQAGNLNINLTSLWHGALVAGLAYLGKNFFTPAQTVTPAK